MAKLLKRIPKSLWNKFLIVVQTDTAVRSHESLWNLVHRARSVIGKVLSRTKSGRPLAYVEIVRILKLIVPENPLWGIHRIKNELLHLGPDVPLTTLRRYLKRLFPDSSWYRRSKALWKSFLANEKDSIAAMDFFTIKVFGFSTLYCWFLIEHGTRKILHANVTFYPNQFWVIQQLREALSWQTHLKYLIFDRDSIFSRAVCRAVKNLGLSVKRTSIHSPWQNAYAERWVKSIRSELFDHVIVFSEAQTRKLIKDYVRYYNESRPHMGLDGKTTVQPVCIRAVTPLGRKISRG